MTEKTDVQAVAELADIRHRIYSEIGRAVVGQQAIVEQLFIGLLAGGIAHDFNNLLMTILTASDRLKTPIHQLPWADRLKERSQK